MTIPRVHPEDYPEGPEPCDECSDEGYIEFIDDPISGRSHREPCPTCNGCGWCDDYDGPTPDDALDYPGWEPVTMWDLDPRLEGPDY